MDRRSFFTEVFRYLLLAIIGIVAGVAWNKSRHVQAGSCPPDTICQSCGKVSKCTSPEKDIP